TSSKNEEGSQAQSGMDSGSEMSVQQASYEGPVYEGSQTFLRPGAWDYAIGDPFAVAQTLSPMPFDWLWTAVVLQQMNTALESRINGDLPALFQKGIVTDADLSQGAGE